MKYNKSSLFSMAFVSMLTVGITGCNKSKTTEEQNSAAEATESHSEEAFMLKTEEIKYKADSIEMIGYIAYNSSAKEKLPAVLVVHEWWGHNSYARKRAEQLASLGYAAMAVDMFGNGKIAEHPKDAGAFAGQVMSDLNGARLRFNAALEQLKSLNIVDQEKTAAIGYCFGGGVVLHMARFGEDLDGVVSFHGSLGTSMPAQPETFKAKVLVMNGAADPFVSEEAINAFKSEMDGAGVEYSFINYDGAVHAFTNPGATELGEKFELPLKYDAKADSASWSEMKVFLKNIFN